MKRQIISFVIVGGINTCITLALYWALLLVLDHNWSYALTFIVGVLFSWAANSKTTFESVLNSKKLPAYGLFYLGSYGIGQFALNWSIIDLGFNEHIAIFFVILISLPINFLGSRFILYEKGKPAAFSDADISRLVSLHMQSLPTSIIARLGKGVTESFYRFVINNDNDILIITRDDNSQIIAAGFVSLDPDKLEKGLKTNLETLFYTALNFFKVPLSTFFSIRGNLTAPLQPELIYLFCDSKLRSRGVGRKLLEQIEMELQSISLSDYFVKTLEGENNKAINFYEANDFHPCGEETLHGLHYVVFKKSIK
ncbi:MAG: GNAT family N-acetyltransferase [Halopseudomonas aestusnigri]